MFVWVMRDKPSEWRAMREFLRIGALPFIPLVEAVCEPYLARDGTAKSPVSVLGILSRKLMPLTDSKRAWIDLGNLLRNFSPNDVAELHRVMRAQLGLASHGVTPVVRTSSPSAVVEAALGWAREEGSGLCIRVDGGTRLSMKAQTVSHIAAASGLPDRAIDLVFDAQDLPRVVSHEALRDLLPLSRTARTWAVLGGTFPRSITDMKPEDYEHRRERGEWTAWRDETLQGGVWRDPYYGDYATQPAIYEPSMPFPGSPSVRYTIGEEYVVLRGRGGSGTTGADYSQYIGHALYLREQSYFCDVLESPADIYVQRIASRSSGTGNLMTWRIASIQRHLHVVAAQVAHHAPMPSRSR